MGKLSWRRRSRSSPRRSKYGNVKTVFQGLTFDSKAELRYYHVLLALKQAGDIIDFERQVPFVLQEAFRDHAGKLIRALTYRADFVVYHDGYTEIIDVKGIETEVFKLKWKLMKYLHKDKNYRLSIVYGKDT